MLIENVNTSVACDCLLLRKESTIYGNYLLPTSKTVFSVITYTVTVAKISWISKLVKHLFLFRTAYEITIYWEFPSLHRRGLGMDVNSRSFFFWPNILRFVNSLLWRTLFCDVITDTPTQNLLWRHSRCVYVTIVQYSYLE